VQENGAIQKSVPCLVHPFPGVLHSPLSATNQCSDNNTSSNHDLFTQLDLWSKLAFDNDEARENYANEKGGEDSSRGGGIINDGAPERALRGGYRDIVSATIEDNISAGAAMGGSMPLPQTPSDLTSLFAGFGPDSPLVPHIPNSQHASIVTSLAQLFPADPSITALFQHELQQSHPLQPPPAYSNQPSPESVSQRRSKRTHTRKLSISTVDSTTDFLDQDGTPSPNAVTPLSLDEDKRRRNTAASARFRLKKKEWETALEKKLKDVEERVDELEKECERLRRENGWLKGLIVGATSAASNITQAAMATVEEGTGGPREKGGPSTEQTSV